MSYSFQGAFIKGSSADLETIVKLFKGDAKVITEPFEGMGIEFDDGLDFDDLDKAKSIMRQRIESCSQRLGNAMVVYIYYVTWAGYCEYCYGFACRKGAVIADSEREMADDSNNKVLRHLVGYLDVTLNSTAYFAPFERGFFD